MPLGDKPSYIDKQKRKAAYIQQDYEDRGFGKAEASQRAWASVNNNSGDGNRSGSGRGTSDLHSSARRGGRNKLSSQTTAERSQFAPKGLETRRRRGTA